MATSINLDVHVPALQIQLQAATIFANLVTNVSQFVTKGNKTVHYDRLSTVEGQDIALGASFATTEQDADYGQDSFDLDRMLGHFWRVFDHENEQSIYDILAGQMNNGLNAIARKADRRLITNAIAGADAFGNNIDAVGTDEVVDFLKLMKILDDQDVPDQDRAYVVTSTTIQALRLALKDQIRFDTDKTGKVGVMFGVEVYTTTLSELTNDILIHKNAMAYAWGLSLIFKVTGEAQSVQDKYSLSKMFGNNYTQGGKLIAVRKVAV